MCFQFAEAVIQGPDKARQGYHRLGPVEFFRGVSQLACKPTGYTHNVSDPLENVNL